MEKIWSSDRCSGCLITIGSLLDCRIGIWSAVGHQIVQMKQLETKSKSKITLAIGSKLAVSTTIRSCITVLMDHDGLAALHATTNQRTMSPKNYRNTLPWESTMSHDKSSVRVMSVMHGGGWLGQLAWHVSTRRLENARRLGLQSWLSRFHFLF